MSLFTAQRRPLSEVLMSTLNEIMVRYHAVCDADGRKPPRGFRPPSAEMVEAAQSALGVALPSDFIVFHELSAGRRMAFWDVFWFAGNLRSVV